MIESLKKLLLKSFKDYSVFFDNQNYEIKSAFLKEQSKEISDAHLYLLDTPGKLIRPLLVLLIAGSIGKERAISVAIPSAVALEFVHTYSLIHDDLPCMDNDVLRRGQATTHMVFGEAKALLVGDGLLTTAFEILSNSKPSLQTDSQFDSKLIVKLIQILTKAIGPRGMIWGQWLDMTQMLESSNKDNNLEIFQTIHSNKTGKLFGACFAMGLMCGLGSVHHSYSEEHIQKMQDVFFQIGHDIGLSFQIRDDILDHTQSSEQIGKTSGKDSKQNKLTAIKLLGLEEAQQAADKFVLSALKNLENFIKEYFEQISNNEYYKTLLHLLKQL